MSSHSAVELHSVRHRFELMKTTGLLACLLTLLAGCANPQGAANAPVETQRDSIREHGTTGLGVGSDTTTQTGIDTGTRSGSGLP